MAKKRYTAEEINAMKAQVFEDDQAERKKYSLIADWVTKKSHYQAYAEVSNYAVNPDNPHIPYYYISIPLSGYDKPGPWIMDNVSGPNRCKPPVAGIYINTEGWMLKEDIPGIGKVNVYVAVPYDPDTGGW